MPALAPPPAPSAPAPAATPAPAPSPSPAPASSVPSPQAAPSAPSGDGDSDPFASLDARIGKRPDKAPGDKTKQPDKEPASKDDRTVTAPKALREQLEKTNGELKTYKERVASYEAKIAEFESKGKDTTALSERLAAIEKERDDARAEARALKQEASPEFKDKWEKPFNQAADYAKSLVEQLQVGEFVQNEETGTREWKPSRAATWEDFGQLYSMPAAKAAQTARQMFGDDAPLVIGQLNDLHRLDYQRGKALEEERTNWKANESKQQADQVRQREAWTAAAAKAEQQLKEKFADRYVASPEDTEAAEFLAEGERLLNQKPKTMQEAAQIHARNKLNAISAHLAFHRVAVQKAEIEELKAEIEELRGGKPGKTRSTTDAPAGGSEKHWSEELRAIPDA